MYKSREFCSFRKEKIGFWYKHPLFDFPLKGEKYNDLNSIGNSLKLPLMKNEFRNLDMHFLPFRGDPALAGEGC
jgi:hypothetical protein